MLTHRDTTMLGRLTRVGAKAAMLAEGLSENYAAQASASHELNMNYYGSIARAILNELKEADEEMVEAGIPHSPFKDAYMGGIVARGIFTAMIDQVLSQGEGK